MKKDSQTNEITDILVAYFSCTGTTKPLAEYAAEYLNADLYEIKAEPPYTSEDLDYNTSDSRAKAYQIGILKNLQGWYPLGGRGHTAELLGDETISAIAKAHGKSSAQVILRWNLQNGVVVIRHIYRKIRNCMILG